MHWFWFYCFWELKAMLKLWKELKLARGPLKLLYESQPRMIWSKLLTFQTYPPSCMETMQARSPFPIPIFSLNLSTHSTNPLPVSAHAWLFKTPQIHPPTLMRTCKSGHLSRTHIPAPSYFSRHLTFSLYTTIIPTNAHHHYIPIYISITYPPHLLMSHVHSFPSSLSSYHPYRRFTTINLAHIVPSTSRFPHDIGHCLTRRHCLLRGF